MATHRLARPRDLPAHDRLEDGPVLFDGYRDAAAEKNLDHLPAGGLRGWKYLVYEGACRVPLIARWPARLKPRVTDQIFSLVDLPATLGRIAGAEISAAASPLPAARRGSAR